ncbi:unnamed protein product [Closterium sp. Yama58-4]|nr:unnamed protein product [Closterium sp. Yama58-4]
MEAENENRRLSHGVANHTSADGPDEANNPANSSGDADDDGMPATGHGAAATSPGAAAIGPGAAAAGPGAAVAGPGAAATGPGVAAAGHGAAAAGHGAAAAGHGAAAAGPGAAVAGPGAAAAGHGAAAAGHGAATAGPGGAAAGPGAAAAGPSAPTPNGVAGNTLQRMAKFLAALRATTTCHKTLASVFLNSILSFPGRFQPPTPDIIKWLDVTVGNFLSSSRFKEYDLGVRLIPNCLLYNSIHHGGLGAIAPSTQIRALATQHALRHFGASPSEEVARTTGC